MEDRPRNERIESNGEYINWNIKTEAEESSEYLTALGLSAYSEPTAVLLTRPPQRRD